MYQVKITKGEETATAVFNEKISAWTLNNYRGRLRSADLKLFKIVFTFCSCCQKCGSSRKLVIFFPC